MSIMKTGVGAIITKKNRILLLLRDTSPEKSCWSLPGGKVEKGENYEDAVKREIYEEIGLIVKECKRVDTFMYKIDNENFICKSILFQILYEGTLINKEKLIHKDISWFDINNLPDNIAIPVKKAIIILKKKNYE